MKFWFTLSFAVARVARCRLSHVLPLVLALGMGATGVVQAQSLYEESRYHPLAGDSKAYRIGDLITVQVFENSSASSSTDTSTQRNNALNVGLTRQPNGRTHGGSIAVGGSFDGGGTTQRANRLLVTLSVNVCEVLANGDLRLAGEQVLTINDEKHKVRLEGRVRPQDIASDNTVLSTRLAEAKINYVGEGHLSDRQGRAWWRKFCDWLGL